jgi:glycogen operon protein
VKNFLTLTLLSLGMPMIAMGDEMRRTQRGNNNAYCQDNEISWLDWSFLEKHGDVKRFFEILAERRLLRDAEPELRRTSLNQILRNAGIAWHGVRCGQPDWSDASRSLAYEATLPKERLQIYIAVNAYWEALDFELPACAASGKHWHRWIDTALSSPDDIVPWRESRELTNCSYRVQPRSILALFANI